jgi:ATP-dependent DNA helicase DinG
MKPIDLELPPKFKDWRPHQLDAIVLTACNDLRFTILNAPPGIGKTTIYMGVSAMLGGRTLALTSTKGLQQQLMDDHGPMGLVEIKGQSNYPCLYFAGDGRRFLPGCDEGPCHAGIECELRDGGCNYYDAVRAAYQSRLVTTNYSYWMTMNRYADISTLGQFDNLVLDEAHAAAQTLADFVKIEIVAKEVRALLALDIPRESNIEEWVYWASNEALPLCRSRLESAKSSVSMFRQSISVVRRLRELETNLAGLANAQGWKRTDAPDPPAWMPGASTDWIIEEDKAGVTFQPVWASGYSEQFLFANIPRIILVSATVTAKDAAYLGIPPETFLYKEYPSPFERRRRPIYVIPTVRVGRNMTQGEERIWINRIDQIIEKEAVEGKAKGIVFTMSYFQAKMIADRSKFRGLIYMHDRHSVRDVVEKFKNARPPAVLISPSVGTGYDFPLDTCRFQVIAKLPFIDSRPAIIRARHRADKKYMDYVTVVELIQRSGRGMRSEQDWVRTYIIDDNFRWFFSRNKGLMPKWFKGSIRRIRSLDEVDRGER